MAFRAAGLLPRITLSPQTITHASGGLLSATAGYGLYSDGNAKQTVGATVSTLEAWIDRVANVGDFECRATLVSGTLTTGTTGSWLALSADRTWSRTSSAGSTNTTVLTVEIRRTATGVVQASVTITLIADAT